MIEEGHIYKFGNKYFLVVGIEYNWKSYCQRPVVFQEAVPMLKTEEITIFRYVVIYIKNLKNIKKSILSCDFDVLPLTNRIKYMAVESFLQYYHKNGKHKELDTTAFALPEEIIRWSGIKL